MQQRDRLGTELKKKKQKKKKKKKKVTDLFNGAADGAVANVSIDLAQEVAPHHCGLQLQVLLVGGNDSSPPRHLLHDSPFIPLLSPSKRETYPYKGVSYFWVPRPQYK